MLYCVINSYGDIIGRFKRYEKASEYFLECSSNGIDNVKMKEMTEKEYEEYMKKLLKNT